MAYTISWNESSPAGASTQADTIDTEFQNLKVSMRERMDQLLHSSTAWATDGDDPKLLDVAAIAGTPKVAHVTDGAAFSVPNTTATTIDWVNEVLDTNTFHDNSTNPSRLTCALAGYYRITCTITLVSGSASSICDVEIRQSGSTIAKTSKVHPGGTTSDSFYINAIALVSATQFFEVRVTQTSGQTWATANSTILTSFIIEKLDGTT